MGQILHHAIVVTSWKDALLEEAHRVAGQYNEHVSPISAETVNGYRSFCVFPDGSKEGWQQSREGNEGRNALIKWMNEHKYEDGSTALSWVEVAYNELDDRNGAVVQRHAWL